MSAESTRIVLKEGGFKIINVEDILNSGVEDDKIFEYGANHKIPIITHDPKKLLGIIKRILI